MKANEARNIDLKERMKEGKKNALSEAGVCRCERKRVFLLTVKGRDIFVYCLKHDTQFC